jgi:hypothetical protein
MSKKAISFGMVVLGVGLLVFGASDYMPNGEYGWSDDCRVVMTAGAMLMIGGWRLP